jgi:hypothetical protein
MAIPFGAMTGRPSAATVRKSQRARQCIFRDLQVNQQAANEATEPGGLRAAGWRNDTIHLIVIIQSDYTKNKTGMDCFEYSALRRNSMSARQA